MDTIRSVCEAYGITQTQLSRRFGIPLRTVQGWYLGERKPPRYVVDMLKTILLDIDLLDLDPKIRGAATDAGQSLQSYILQACYDRMERDAAKKEKTE